MTQTAYAQEIVLIILILLYSTVLAKSVPTKYHLYLNISITALAILLGFSFGLNVEQMGLALGKILPGIFIAFAAVVVIVLFTSIVATIPVLRRFFLGDNLAHASGKLITYEATIRVPFGTALIEEVLFRGVLLGLLLQHNSSLVAILISAIIFGLWHIFPTIAMLENNKILAKANKDLRRRKYGSIIGVVLITASAGVVFAWLRIISNSVVAPWLVHWSINSSGMLGIAIARKLEKSKSINLS
ncbi:CPBP family intramembrane metalloprotease [Candidatus Nomurabacteria bacterium]|jgi:membrane protease YdiL (CAAX protease family)|nr:CPBP family intramembrane metalloprotease [Candidatus Saccharibacteria bacterium]MCB9839659.1 CPBP family intramembrane metalloprotease [Candidatus Nomurabacteria bacterium]